MQTIYAANLHAINDLRYEPVPCPKCEDDEVIVKVKSCGICGSDISRVYTKGTYHFPTVIGHEFSGEVAYDPANELTGKKVVVFPLLPCFTCENCNEGNYATCKDYNYYGSRCDGGMSESLAVKRWNLVMMPKSLSFDEGAMCEPVSVARHAVLKLDIQKNDDVLITGAGPIGIIAGQWAKLMGAKDIYYIDIDKEKIEFAKKMGFFGYDEGVTVDCFIEGTGYGDALEKALTAVKPRGKAVLMGNPGGDVTLSQNTYWHILRKELSIRGTWNSSFNDVQNDWKESLQAISEGKINVKPLITHKYPLAKCKDAFEMMKNRGEFYSKVILNMNGEKI